MEDFDFEDMGVDDYRAMVGAQRQALREVQDDRDVEDICADGGPSCGVCQECSYRRMDGEID